MKHSILRKILFALCNLLKERKMFLRLYDKMSPVKTDVQNTVVFLPPGCDSDTFIIMGASCPRDTAAFILAL